MWCWCGDGVLMGGDGVLMGGVGLCQWVVIMG